MCRAVMSVLLVLIGFGGTESVSAERTFTHRITIAIPAREAFRDPADLGPKTFNISLPDNYEIIRDSDSHGTTESEVNLGGLTEVARQIEQTDTGLRLIWQLKNEKTYPAAGRTASMVLELKGRRVEKMTLSEQYHAKRKRFFDKFYFSGMVAERVDESQDGGAVKFADQTIYLGQSLMFLSSEMAILRDRGEDSSDAAGRIKEILDALDQLDRIANRRYGGDSTNPDGFFVRDDITGPSDPRLGGRFKSVASDWQSDDEAETPSGDQIFGLMHGLHCVVLHSGDDALSARAKAASARLYEYARRSYFVLELPDGDSTRRGSDMRWLSSLLHGLNKEVTGEDRFNDSRIKIAGVKFRLNAIAQFWDEERTARQIERLAGESLRIPVINQELELNSFALHILLMALAPGEQWSQHELERVALKCNHHLSILYYCAVHGVLPNGFDEATAKEILASCPEDGPRAGLPSDTGWQRDNRWIRCTSIFEPNDGTETFNGVDWLVFHNFYQLVFAGE